MNEIFLAAALVAMAIVVGVDTRHKRRIFLRGRK